MITLLIKFLPLLDKWSSVLLDVMDKNKQAKEAWYNIVSRFAEFHSNSANATRIYNEQKSTVQEEAAKRLNS